MTRSSQVPAAVDRLQALYADSVDNLRTALADFLERGVRPDPAARAAGAFAYPELRLTWRADQPRPRLDRAYARLSAAGRLCHHLHPAGACSAPI